MRTEGPSRPGREDSTDELEVPSWHGLPNEPARPGWGRDAGGGSYLKQQNGQRSPASKAGKTNKGEKKKKKHFRTGGSERKKMGRHWVGLLRGNWTWLSGCVDGPHRRTYLKLRARTGSTGRGIHDTV